MSRKLQKSLKDYLKKIKKPTHPLQFPNPQSFSSSKGWILARCKHPKTLSFAVDRNHGGAAGNTENTAATLADIDQFLVENFRSLYLKEEEDFEEKKIEEISQTRVPPESPVDSCNGSHRFFFSPGLSRSILDESQTDRESSEIAGSSSSSASICELLDQPSKDLKIPSDCIAILRYSPNPSEEFRGAMQEMMDSRMKEEEKVDWEFMEEVLFGFLNMNNKKSHKYILNAFVDLIVIWRKKAEDLPAAKKLRTVRSVRMVKRML